MRSTLLQGIEQMICKPMIKKKLPFSKFKVLHFVLLVLSNLFVGLNHVLKTPRLLKWENWHLRTSSIAHLTCIRNRIRIISGLGTHQPLPTRYAERRIMCYLQGGAWVWSLPQCPSSSLSSSLLSSPPSFPFPSFLSYSLHSLLTSSCLYFLPLFSFQVFLSSICHFPRVVSLWGWPPLEHSAHTLHVWLPPPHTPMVLSELTIWLGFA